MSKYSGEDGGVELIVQDVSTAISALGISPERTIIVGHSMGGIVASELALMLQVAGAVLLGPVYPNDSLASIFNARIQLVQGSKCPFLFHFQLNPVMYIYLQSCLHVLCVQREWRE